MKVALTKDVKIVVGDFTYPHCRNFPSFMDAKNFVKSLSRTPTGMETNWTSASFEILMLNVFYTLFIIPTTKELL